MSDAPSSSAEVDPAALERLVRFGGRPLLESLVEIFRVHGAARVTAAERAAEDGNAEDARIAFHSLRSSAAQIGAVRLSELCREGETRASSASAEELRTLARRARAELERALQWMDRAGTDIASS